MPIELKMPALSPTMEEGTLAKWLVKEGDAVKPGDILAEIETDKATMEYEAVDEGTIAQIAVPEGTEGVIVGAVIATIVEAEEAGKAMAPEKTPEPVKVAKPEKTPEAAEAAERQSVEKPAPEPDKGGKSAKRPSMLEAAGETSHGGDRVVASPLARRIAEQRGLDLSTITGSGPNGRVVKADLEGAATGAEQPGGKPEATKAEAAAPAPAKVPSAPPAVAPAKAAGPPASEIPHETVKLSNMRKVIARRLTESKQTVPHIYMTVDVMLDPLLKLREKLNAELAGSGIKLSVNDLLVKALAVSLIEVPECNVQFAGDQLLKFSRADIAVAVSIPGGLITPIVVNAAAKSVSTLAREMKDLAERARTGKLKPDEYQGGTASLSNMGMLGITQFDAVINPPQAMILAAGAGDRRPWVVDEKLEIATVMSATGSFDHRVIDGADGARLMTAFKRAIEMPLILIA